jgi:hypothetical protein
MVMSAEINIDKKNGNTDKVSGILSSNELTVVYARNHEEIEAIREAWKHIHGKEPQPTPDADIDRFLSVVKSLGPGVRPFVILVKREDRPVAMVVGRIERRRLEFKFGYKVLGAKTLKCLTVVYGGILGGPDEALCLLLLAELRKHLKSREYDIVYFNHLRTQECFYRSIGKVFGFMTRGCKPKIEEHWRMSIPDSIDAFYAARSRNHRRNLRQAIRKFEETFPSKNNFIKYTSIDDVPGFIELSADISTKTYQGALGAGIENNEGTVLLECESAKHGWFDGNILYCSDKPCAFQLALRYGQAYYMVKIGYDPAIGSYKPGTVLFLKILESICEDPSIHMLDFYFGDAEYKHRYGTEHWPEAIVYLFAPRGTLILLNLLRSSLMCINSRLAYIVKKAGSLNWVKRRWRDRLQAKE